MAKDYIAANLRSAGSRSSVSEHDRSGQERFDLAILSQADRPSVPRGSTKSNGRLHQSRRSVDPLWQCSHVQWAQWNRDRRVAGLVDGLSSQPQELRRFTSSNLCSRTADWRREFEQVIQRRGGASTTQLVPDTSPDAVISLGDAGARWSFAFIDGDHDGEAPTQDALACEPYLEATAMVVFHDLVSPHVSAGLRALAAKGWNVMAYQTAQMMGVAWRGEIDAFGAQTRPLTALGRSCPSSRDTRYRTAIRPKTAEPRIHKERTGDAARSPRSSRCCCTFRSLPLPASADDAQVARGRYLVTIAGCSDCHTPWRPARRTRHEAISRRIGRRLLHSRRRRLRRARI